MVEEGTRGGICQVIHHYETANKYMKDYNKNVISSFLECLDANNLYGWAMCKKLPIGKIRWAKKLSVYTEQAIKMYNENNDYGAILEVYVEYPAMARIRYQDLSFLTKQKKIKKVHKLVTTLDDKERYIVYISALKQALDHGLKLKKVHRVIEFKQQAWLKPYIDKNNGLRKDAKNEFEKDLFKLMNKSVYGKTMEKVRNHRDLKLFTANAKRRRYVPEPNYMSSKCFSKDFIAIEMRKTKVLMNKPVYLGQAILDISKTLMYEFYYDYLKSKYGDKVRLCYMDTDSFILQIQTEDFYKDIANDVNILFDTSGYAKKLNRPLPTRINEKVIDTFKDELNGKVIAEFCAPRAKTYALKDEDNKERKRAKGTKKSVTENDLKLEDYKDSVLKNKIVLRSQQRFKSQNHKVFTEEVNKIAISSNDDKRIQDFDGITTHAYGTLAFKVCESEMLVKRWGKPIAMYY